MSISLHGRTLAGFMIAAATVTGVSASAFAAEKTLTVYTYESFITEWGPGAKVSEAFEKVCDCKVDYVGVADGSNC